MAQKLTHDKPENNRINPKDVEHKPNQDTSNMRSILNEIGIVTTATNSGQDAQSSKQPKFRYTKEQLVSLSNTSVSKRRPAFLDPAFFNDAGVWDPERWVLNERNDGLAHHPEEHKSKRERPVDLDRDIVLGPKRRSSDPKERLKEEQDGIILSPQRRSFGTGCHVSQQIGGIRRSESPTDNRNNDRDNHRESGRRIGSGRFISRDRDRERDFGYRNSERRDWGDRYDRDDRDMREHRVARDKIGGKDLDRRGNKGFRRIEEEEEPEWFSGGPTSQSETIELRGFDDVPDENRSHEKSDDKDGGGRRDRRRSWRKQKTPSVEESMAEKADESKETSGIAERQQQKSSRPSSVSDEHRSNSSKDSLAGENTGKTDASTSSSKDFDFNDLFKLDMQYFPLSNGTPPDGNSSSGLVGSRFGQFFLQREMSPLMNNSSDTSRRSSFQDELVPPIINSEPVISRSPSDSTAYFTPISPAQRTQPTSDTKNLLEMLQASKGNDRTNAHLKELTISGKAASVKELEAGLKSLVLGNNNQNSGGEMNSNTGVPLAQSHRDENGDLNAFNKLLSHISDGQISTSAFSLGPPLDSSKVLREKDLLQSGGNFVVQTAQDNVHLMNILKHGPTEDDILAGLVKGQPISSSLQASVTPTSQSGVEMLAMLANSSGTNQLQAQSSRSPTSKLHPANPLSKIIGAHQPISSSASSTYNYSSDLITPHSSSALPMQLGVRSNQIPHENLMPQHQLPAANSIQQQQREILAAILKQQKQQQCHVGQPRQPSPIQPPLIQRSSSPPSFHSQTSLINGPVSPQPHSPHRGSDNIQQALLQQQQQQQQRARIPSPLVFGQTPPVISHAPSPIHPGQMTQTMAPATNNLNPNTLQVHGSHVMARVPSPQELRAHTQQIMQNALIKKKLEEQKENFRKRQEMQGSHSPNTTKVTESGVKNTSGMSQSLSIIPTSVMRKMQAVKDKDGTKIGCQQLHLSSQQLVDNKTVGTKSAMQTNVIGGVMTGDIDKLQGPNLPRPVHPQSFVNGQITGRSAISQVSMAPNISASQGSIHGRRIVKSNAGLQGQRVQVAPQPQMIGNQTKSYLAPSNNMDATKQLLMQQQQVAAASQRQMNVSPMSTATSLGHPGLSIRGTGSLHAGPVGTVRPGINLATAQNNYLLRNMVHPANTLSQLNQLAVLQQQQRSVDPRQFQPSTNPMIQSHGLHPLALQQLLMGSNTRAGATGGHISGNLQPAAAAASMMGKNDPLFQLSASAAGVSTAATMNSANFSSFLKNGNTKAASTGKLVTGRRSPGNPSNLDKWFGADLKQTMTNMPPVPTQRAQYVEEVEQRQQVTTVQN